MLRKPPSVFSPRCFVISEETHIAGLQQRDLAKRWSSAAVGGCCEVFVFAAAGNVSRQRDISE